MPGVLAGKNRTFLHTDLLAVIFLIFWSCWTTECWPLKRRSPCVPVLGSTPACLRRRQHNDGSSQCISKTALVLALLGTGLCAFGLYADSEQTYVLDDGLPSELEQIITLEDQARTLVNHGIIAHQPACSCVDLRDQLHCRGHRGLCRGSWE